MSSASSNAAEAAHAATRAAASPTPSAAAARADDAPAPAHSPSTTSLIDTWPHATVLVVDDEPGMCHFIEGVLKPRIGTVMVAPTAEAAEALLRQHRVDLLVLDIALPGKSGLDLLRERRADGDDSEAVLITAFADLETAIEALRAGAGDLLVKPFRVTQLLHAVQRGLERARLRRENWLLKRSLEQRAPPADGLVGRSLVVKGLQAALRRVAPVDSTVLLTGGPGTGKELAAQTLHMLSPRAAAPFVPVRCSGTEAGALEVELFGRAAARAERGAGKGAGQSDGLLVVAQGGTLFLDDVAELTLDQQAALLRAIDTRRIKPVGSNHDVAVDVRIVAASSQALRPLVDAGRLRADLYYRLQVVEINLPPLASHREDIPDLVQHFIETLAPQLGVAPIEVNEAEMRYLQQYAWPGNVRELRNLIERSLIVGALNVSALYQGLSRSAPAGAAPGSTADAASQGAAHAQGAGAASAGGAIPAALPAAGAGAASAAPTPSAPSEGPVDLQTLEKRHILAVLASVGGDKSRAAELLGISRRTLERRVAEWGA